MLLSLAECAWTDMEFLKKFRDTIQSVFPVVQYAFGVFMPVYIGGQCGFYLAGKNKVRRQIVDKQTHLVYLK